MRRAITYYLGLLCFAALMLAAVVLTSAVTIRKHPVTSHKLPAVQARSTNRQLTRALGASYSYSPISPTSRARLLEAYGKLPLSFEVNQGQTDSRVKFLSHGRGYSLFLTSNETVLTLRKSSQWSKAVSGKAARRLPTKEAWLRPAAFIPNRAAQSRPRMTDVVLRMRLVGANAKARVIGLDELPGKSNYFIGSDSRKWRTNVPNYAEVKYANVYPGIDLVYHGSEGQLEYDLRVAPGADVHKIALRFAGVDRVDIDANGELILQTAGGQVYSHRPIIYQEVNGHRKIIAGGYQRKNRREAGFWVSTYDSTQALTIDPTVTYATFVSGFGDDIGKSIGVDSVGNVYVTGSTTSPNFATLGALQTSYVDSLLTMPFVAKLNATGSALIYSTFLDGNAPSVTGSSPFDSGNGIAVDSGGNAYVTGLTATLDFPTTFLGGNGDPGGFLAKLSPTGSSLLYSLETGTDSNLGVAVDTAGEAYVIALDRTSNPSCDNPAMHKFRADGSGELYESPIGSCFTTLRGIAVDPAGNAYVTGYTSELLHTTIGAFQPNYAGGPWDAFVAKIDNANLGAIDYLTYLGGSGLDQAYGIAVDLNGNVYVTGATGSSDFPTRSPFQSSLHSQGCCNAFVAKLDPSGLPVYSTFLGGSRDDAGTGIGLDTANNAYVTGFTASPDFPAVPASTLPGPSAFVTKISTKGSALVYSLFLGGGGSQNQSNGIAVDGNGSAYVAGYSNGNFFARIPTNIQFNLGSNKTGLSRGGLSVFAAKIAGGCQVTLPKTFKQFSGTWADDVYDKADTSTWCRVCPNTNPPSKCPPTIACKDANPPATKMSRWGCLTTNLAMALNFAGVTKIGTQDLTPGTLNQYMKDNGGYNGGSAQLDVTTTKLSSTLKYKENPETDSTVDPDAAYKILDDFLCAPDPHPVIVHVHHPKGPPGYNHFVLVYAKEDRPDGSTPAQYLIADPGSSNTTSLDNYNREFGTRGAVMDPSGDFSSVTANVNKPATLLVVDPTGLRTGFDPMTSATPQDIPNSAYNEDAITDIVTGSVGDVGHLVQILQPAQGNYQLTVNGLSQDTYTLSVSPFSQDGIAEPAVNIPGIAGVGTTATFQVQLITTPGSTSQVTKIATFQSTLDDIRNSLGLGLIDNQGIANSLSEIIQNAANAAGRGDQQTASNILEAFKNDVTAQTGQHVAATASQVLLQDADSLISQNS